MVVVRKRALCALLLAGLVWLGAFALPAAAVEEGGPGQQEQPTIDEVGTQSQTAREFFPDPYEAPSVNNYLVYPLLVAGIAISLVVLLLYLVWQPDFARERRTKKRR